MWHSAVTRRVCNKQIALCIELYEVALGRYYGGRTSEVCFVIYVLLIVENQEWKSDTAVAWHAIYTKLHENLSDASDVTGRKY
jgi:hypothetical protein